MPKTFVVTERQPLVRVDLEQQLREVAPTATVHGFATPEEAMAHLAGMTSLTGAVSSASFDDLRGSPFARRVDELGGWLVCTSERHKAEIDAAGWHLLRVPFSSEAAYRLFAGLVCPRSGRPAN